MARLDITFFTYLSYPLAMEWIAVFLISVGAFGRMAPEETLKTAIADHDLPLFTSTLADHPELVEWKYADIESATPLLLAACGGFARGVEYLLKINANANATTQNGFGLVHMAVCRSNGASILNIMQVHGLPLTAVDNQGNSAAHIAAMADNAEAVDFLVARNFDLFQANSLHDRPIHMVKLSRFGAAVPSLVQAGVSVDVETDSPEKYSALQMTCDYAVSSETVYVLIASGANPNYRDKWGETAMNHLLQRRHEDKDVYEILEILLAAGADPNIMSLSCETPMTKISYWSQYFPKIWPRLKAANGKVGGVGPDGKCKLFHPL